MKRTTITPSSPVACPFEITPASKFLGKADVTPCAQPPQANGWCHAHQYAARLLEVARSYGCPCVELEHLIVGRGLRAWEGYCERATKEHAAMVEATLKSRYGGMFEKRGVA